MEKFVYVYAWILAISLIIKAIRMATVQYPRKVETNLGTDVVGILLSGGLFAWTQYLLH